jgi:hypothetical protein
MLSTYIESPEELATLEYAPSYSDLVEAGIAEPQYADFQASPELDQDDDTADAENLLARRRACAAVAQQARTGQHYAAYDHKIDSPAVIAADVKASQEDEHSSTVERLLTQAEETLTPSVCFSRCWDLLEPCSRTSFKTTLYVSDVHIACRRALSAEPVLLHLYKLLYEQGQRKGIPVSVLLRNPMCQQIAFLCGQRLRTLRLWNYSAYLHRERHHHSERRFAV